MRRKHSLVFILGILALVGSLLSAQDNEPLYSLPNTRIFSSGSMALSTDGRILVVANMLSNSMSIVQPGLGQVAGEIPVGSDPRSIALTPDGTRALVVNRADGTLSVVSMTDQILLTTIPIGVLPYAVVTDDDDSAYVSVQGSDEVIQVDLNSGDTIERFAVPDSPAGLTLWGDFLYVTHLWSGEFSLIYLPQRSVARTISTGMDTSLSQAIEIDPATGLAYLPQSRSNAQNMALTYDSTIWPVVNVVDLNTMGLIREQRIALDSADRPVNMPFAAALDRVRRALYVVNAGSNDLSAIDLTTGFARAHVDVGANPRSVLLNRDGSFVYVHNVLDGTITFIETRNLTVTDVLPVSSLSIPADVLIGAQLFHSSADSRLSANNWSSCASCHFDGQSDGRTWLGFPDGARNTPSLFHLLETAPYTWTGEWDELADVDDKIHNIMAGDGLIEAGNPASGDPNAGLSLDMDALTAYLATLEGPENPNRFNSSVVERGQAVFEEQDCTSCHSGDTGTDLLRHDVGTGGEFDTPMLRWLWMSAPYFHDGSAEELDDVFMLPGTHQLIRTLPADDIDALVAYLLSRP